MPWRVWEAIEEAVLLARGGVELRARSGGDQLSGEVAACILEGIFRPVEQDGRWTAFGDLPTGHGSAGRALRRLAWRATERGLSSTRALGSGEMERSSSSGWNAVL